jgi:alpha-L-rhamnosidase
MPTHLQVSDLRFEHHPTGFGIPNASPRLSWKVKASPDDIPQNWHQGSYEVQIKRSIEHEAKTWRVDSPSSVLVPWPDTPLASAEAATVRVRVFGENKTTGTKVNADWCDWIPIEAGLLRRDDWKAQCISAPERKDVKHADENGIRPVRFRKTFSIPGSPAPEGARLYITALGLYEAYLNGSRVGDECLAPGWTSYQSRIQYQVFDVGPLLRVGQTNTLQVEVGEGWYAGRLLWEDGITCFYGDRIGVVAQLSIPGEPNYLFATDDSWECSLSPIVASGIYDGETYDMGEEDRVTQWGPVDAIGLPKQDLVASSCPPVRVTEVVRPVRIFQDPDGKTLVDFGQNLVGKILIHSLLRPAGHRLRIRHAEVLEHGKLGVRPLRRAKATDTLVFGESGRLENWTPRFTFHGFRYAEIDGWSPNDTDNPLTAESLSALVLHTDMQRTGYFECSNPDVNQLHCNVTWSMRGNFVSIPTDCPQRDERLGWTGDIQVFAPTASYIYACGGMLANWMRDVIIDQRDSDGIVPLVVPNAMKHGPWPAAPQAVWDDVVILVPWTLYKWTGDLQALRDSYSGMKDYLRTLKRGQDGLWDPNLWQLGDWLDPGAPPAEPGLARTDGVLVADSYLVYVTGILSRIAAILGESEDAAHYENEAGKLKICFQSKYIAPSGLVVSDTQTGLALSLLFSLHATEEQRQIAAARLAKLVRSYKFRVSTGFAGTPAILHALSTTGNTNLAYRMLLETGCPSWLYPVSMGATTIWERWDSMLEDGSINPGQMTSFNHYALGCVAEWLHASVGGLAPLESGWKKFAVQPTPGGDIQSANARFISPYGEASCEWKIADKRMQVKVTVPPNSSAVVTLPDGSEQQEIGSGKWQFECDIDTEESAKWPPKPLLTEFQDDER